ncbi:MAG TPA: hypothetical protein VI979_03755 [archaeon]|nr:hypothetical protein [archaeon]
MGEEYIRSSHNGLERIDALLNDFDSIRIVLYLDKYNPNVLLSQLEENLNIDRATIAKKMDLLIKNEFVINDKGKFKLSNFGKVTATNLKRLA